MTVLLARTDGGFDPPLTFAAGIGEVFGAADINVDGRPDLYIQRSGPDAVEVFPGLGDGTFGPSRTLAWGDLRSLLLRDLNDDGAVDWLPALTEGAVVFLLNDGAGEFHEDRRVTADAYFSEYVDVNRDHLPDLLAAGDGLGVHHQRGDGSFAPPVRLAVPAPFTPADINNDGTIDFLTEYAVYLGDCEGCPGDLDEDGAVGLPDLERLVANFGASGVRRPDGDVDIDGDVDLHDLSALLGQLGGACR